MAIRLGIDPGPKGKGCGFALMDEGKLRKFGLAEPNLLFCHIHTADVVIIEMITSYGMAVGMEVFETLVEIGRLVQMCMEAGTPVYLLPRTKIKLIMCGTSQAKDKNIRASVLDKFARSGGGSIPQIGVMKQKGPLYGVSSHVWPALAAVLAYVIENRDPERGIDFEDYLYTVARWNDFRIN